MSGLTNFSAVRQPTAAFMGETVGRRSDYGDVVSGTALTGIALIEGDLNGGGQGGGEAARIERLAGGFYTASGEYGDNGDVTAVESHIASTKPITFGAAGPRGGTFEQVLEPADAIGTDGTAGGASSFDGYTAVGGSGIGRGGRALYLGSPDSYSLTNYTTTNPVLGTGGNGGAPPLNGQSGRLLNIWVED